MKKSIKIFGTLFILLLSALVYAAVDYTNRDNAGQLIMQYPEGGIGYTRICAVDKSGSWDLIYYDKGVQVIEADSLECYNKFIAQMESKCQIEQQMSFDTETGVCK